MNSYIKYLINQYKLITSDDNNIKKEIQLEKLKRCVAIVGDDKRGKSRLGNKIINELTCDLKVDEIYLFNYFKNNTLVFHDSKTKFITEKSVLIRLRNIKKEMEDRLNKLIKQINDGGNKKCKDKYVVLYFYNMFDIIDFLAEEERIEYYSLIEEIILKANKLNVRVIYETYSLLNKDITPFIKEQTKIEILIHSKQNVITPFLNDILNQYNLSQKDLTKSETIIINRNLKTVKKLNW